MAGDELPPYICRSLATMMLDYQDNESSLFAREDFK